MVNRGASKGCITCRLRRVKCDQAKPRCGHCLRLGRECAGYGKKTTPVRFKDETTRYFGGPSSKRKRVGIESQSPLSSPSPSLSSSTTTTTTTPTSTIITIDTPPLSHYDNAIIPSPPPSRQDLAIAFFLTYATDLGRGVDSTRGFMEFVRPALASERHDSALSTAINAVAAKVWDLVGVSDLSASPTAKLQSQAVARLHTAVKDPKERSRDATVLAALVLQLYETLSAVFGQHRPDRVHRDGASALLLHRSGDAVGSKFYGSLLGNMFHSRVSMCVRGRIPFYRDEIVWLQSQVIPILPANPSSLLDVVGVSIANLQYAVCESPLPSGCALTSALKKWSQDVLHADSRLQEWLEIIPPHWFPASVRSRECGILSHTLYQGACDVYPSIQIASLWNVWRIYRLILVQVKLRLTSNLLALRSSIQPMTDNIDGLDDISENAQNIQEAQELVDSICASVPFYLGNRVDPTVFADTEDPRHTFPSYHDLPPSDEAFSRYQCSESYLSKADHARHAVLQGPWRIMSILSHLMGVVSEKRNTAVAQGLRQEQKDWMTEQFLRSLYIQRLIPSWSFNMKDCGDGAQAHDARIEASEAGCLASRIRQGLWTMDIV